MKYKERMIVTTVAIILIILIGYTGRERENISRFENLTGKILIPVADFSSSIQSKIGGVFANLSNLRDAREENEELKLTIRQLESENRDLKNIIGKSDYLLKEMILTQNTRYNLIKAQVTAKEPGFWFDQFVINKGSKDGIKKGDTVVQAVETEKGIFSEALVGRVVDIGDTWSEVVSVVDELNSTAFKIVRTQDGGIVSGNIEGKLEGYLYDYTADVIEGDELYTSGLGGVYLKDIYIGHISMIISDREELTKRLVIEPAINFRKLYNVFIISE